MNSKVFYITKSLFDKIYHSGISRKFTLSNGQVIACTVKNVLLNTNFEQLTYSERQELCEIFDMGGKGDYAIWLYPQHPDNSPVFIGDYNV